MTWKTKLVFIIGEWNFVSSFFLLMFSLSVSYRSHTMVPINKYPLVYNGAISPGQKWWQTVLEIEISCSQWEALACAQSALIFFLLSFGRGGLRIFFIFSLFPTCLHQVLIMFSRFPMCSPRVFPIAPHFPPICFAQSPPLSHLYTWPKGEALHLSIEFSKVSTFFFAIDQSNWLIAKRKTWTCEAPQTN